MKVTGKRVITYLHAGGFLAGNYEGDEGGNIETIYITDADRLEIYPNDSNVISEIDENGTEYTFKNLSPEPIRMTGTQIKRVVKLSNVLNTYFSPDNEPDNMPQIPYEHYAALRVYNGNKSLVNSFAEQNGMNFSAKLNVFIEYNAHQIYGISKNDIGDILPQELLLKILNDASSTIRMGDNITQQFLHSMDPLPEDHQYIDVVREVLVN